MVAQRILNDPMLERYPALYIRFMYTWRIRCNLAGSLRKPKVRIISINHTCTRRYRNRNWECALLWIIHIPTTLNSSFHLANYAHSSVHTMLCFYGFMWFVWSGTLSILPTFSMHFSIMGDHTVIIEPPPPPPPQKKKKKERLIGIS